MQTLEQFSPDVEVYSIDEAFVGLPGDVGCDRRAAAATVLQWTGIPVSVGVATTKTLAKVANHLAKRGTGVCVLTDPTPVLADLPVGETLGHWSPAQSSAAAARHSDRVTTARSGAALDSTAYGHRRGAPGAGAEGNLLPTAGAVPDPSEELLCIPVVWEASGGGYRT
jgi:hypothetical protein